MNTHPARVVAAVGAVIAAGTTTVLALTAGTAAADEPGRCTQNVNVREEPDATSRIVALCEADTEVMPGAERDGFVFMDKLHGWASADFVKADGSAADAVSIDDADGAASDDGDAADREDAGTGAEDGDARSPQSGGDSADRSDSTDAVSTDAVSTDAVSTDAVSTDAGSTDATPAPRRAGGLAGLLR